MYEDDIKISIRRTRTVDLEVLTSLFQNLFQSLTLKIFLDSTERGPKEEKTRIAGPIKGARGEDKDDRT